MTGARDSLACCSFICNLMASSRNIKPSIYIGPHTWEPCVTDSLTHRLDPCGHLVVTKRLETCGRNCLNSKQAGKGRVRDLDQVFLRPACPDFALCPTCTFGGVGSGSMKDEASDSPNIGSEVLGKTAINKSISTLLRKPLYEKREMRMKAIVCESVL